MQQVCQYLERTFLSDFASTDFRKDLRDTILSEIKKCSEKRTQGLRDKSTIIIEAQELYLSRA